MHIDPTIASIIRDRAARYQTDPDYLLRTAWIESRGNPNAKNPGSSAEGLFQFINSTASNYGLQNRRDPGASADAAARLTRDNERFLEKGLGRKPTAGEKYLSHQQGAAGALKLLQNPNALASNLVGTNAVRLNGGRPDMTAREFASLWTQKFSDNTKTRDDTMRGFTPDFKNFANGINQGGNQAPMQQQMPEGQGPTSVVAQWKEGDRSGALGRGAGAVGRMIEQLSSGPQESAAPMMLQAPQPQATPLVQTPQLQQPSSITQLLAALGRR